MAYCWGPNRDSGSVRRHRNPDTKRRYPRSEIGMMFKANNGRARMNNAMHAHAAELATGLFDIVFTPVRHGWDNGDPLSTSALLVLADPTEDPFEYPEVPEYIWDAMFAATCGLDDDYLY